ncbi:MAG: 4Fe-4S dicluster domain-containing protein [Candidatus Nezhaarchaeales archaeon]
MPLSRRSFLKLVPLVAAAAAVNAGAIETPFDLKDRYDHYFNYSILFDNTRCIGCNSCVVACRLWNGSHGFSEQPVRVTAAGRVLETIGPVLLEGKVGPTEPPSPPRLDKHHLLVIEPHPELRASRGRAVFQRRSCMHCVDPPCMYVCPTGAIYQSNGVNLTDFTKCFGCQYCVVACPYGARVFYKEKGVPIKCWMCMDRLEQGLAPACVSVCPTGALDFGRRGEIVEKANSRARELRKMGRDAYIWGAEEKHGTNVIFVSDVPFEEIGGFPEPEMRVPAPEAMPRLLVERGGIAIFTGAAFAFLSFALWRRAKIIKAKIKEIPRR